MHVIGVKVKDDLLACCYMNLLLYWRLSNDGDYISRGLRFLTLGKISVFALIFLIISSRTNPRENWKNIVG